MIDNIKHYKLIISYEGTNYYGWQLQKDVVTISSTLQKVFRAVFKHDVSILGASRTDTGVHALGQVALAKTSLQIDTIKLVNAWNNGLPKDIVIRSISLVSQNFHPLKNVLQKTYYYHFFIDRPLPMIQIWGWFLPITMRYLNFRKLEECLKLLGGTHDFRSFSTGYDMDSTIRTIDEIYFEFVPEINGYRIVVKGKSFLRYMIRRIVGAALEIASRYNVDSNEIIRVLEQKNPEQTLPNAPAKGLMLYNIEYSNNNIL